MTTPAEEWAKDLFGIGETELKVVPRDPGRQSSTEGWIAVDKKLPESGMTSALREWQAAGEAVPAGSQFVSFNLQGSTPKTLVIDGLEIKKDCKEAMAGTHFRQAGGGLVTTKQVTIDLDSPVVKVVPAVGDMAVDPEESPGPTTFPLGVSDKETAQFLIIVSAGKFDCEWDGVLRWSADGKDGSTKLNNKGKPFRLTGTSAKTNDVVYYE